MRAGFFKEKKLLQNIVLTLAYDGTFFEGFQEQPYKRTVGGVLRKAVELVTGRTTRLIVAGRTDSGVHADAQIVNFLSVSDIPADRFYYNLKKYLPDDILVYRSEGASLRFHARFHSTWKTYCYVLSRGPLLHPKDRYRMALCSYPLNIERMKRAAGEFLGTHDFSAFSLPDPERSVVRTITECTIKEEGNHLIFTIQGDAFLRQQVRIMAGALVDVGRGKLSADEISYALEHGSRIPIAPTLPACGLTLSRIYWKNPEENGEKKNESLHCNCFVNFS